MDIQDALETTPATANGRPSLKDRIERSLLARLRSMRGLELARFEPQIRCDEELRMDYVDTACLLLDAALEIPEIKRQRLFDGSPMGTPRTLGELLNWLLSAVDGALYAHHLVFAGPPLFAVPALQRVALGLLLGWMIAIAITLLRKPA